MFRSQRNFYLTGFCMVQLLVIARIYSLLKQVNKLEATQTALKKQAEGAAAAADGGGSGERADALLVRCSASASAEREGGAGREGGKDEAEEARETGDDAQR